MEGTMTVRMPDGQVVQNVPEGTTKAQLAAKTYDGMYKDKMSMGQLVDSLEIRPEGEDGFWNTIKSPLRFDTFKQFMGGSAKGLVAEESMMAEAMKVLTGRTDKAAEDAKEEAFGDPVSRQMFEIATVMDEIEVAEGTGSPLYKEWATEYDKLAARSEEKPQEFSLKAFKAAVAQDPGAVGGELANAVMADPYLMLTPIGWEKAAASAASTVLRTGKSAIRAGMATAKTVRAKVILAKGSAGVVGSASTGAAVMAPISVFEQLNENGTIDESRLATEVGIGAAASTGIAAMMRTAGVFNAVARSRGIKPAKVEAEFHAEEDLAGAMRRFYEEAGVVPTDDVVKLLPAPEQGRVIRVDSKGVARLSTASEDASALAAKDRATARYIERVVAEDRTGPDVAAIAMELKLPPQMIEETIKRVPAERRLAYQEPKPITDPARLLEADMSNTIEVGTSGTARKLTRLEAEPTPIKGVDESAFSVEAKRLREHWGVSQTRRMSRDEDAALQGARESYNAQRAIESEKLRVPTKERFSRQSGEVDPATLAALVVGASGAAIGYKIGDQSIDGAIGGALVGLGTFVAARALPKLLKHVSRAADDLPPIRIDKLADDAEGQMAAMQRASWQVSEHIREAVPKTARREAITHWLEGDKSIKLTPDEKTVAKQVRGFLDKTWASAKADGVIQGFIQNYVPHLWRRGARSKSELMRSLTGRSGGSGRSPKTLHGKERLIPSYKAGIEAGLEPTTLDIADLVKLYADGVNRARTNKRLIGSLRDVAGDRGKLIQPVDKAPSDFVSINHPQLIGSAVHPDIAPSLKFLFDASDPGVVVRGMTALNFASKRSLVSMSLFHLNALWESLIYASGHPGGAVKLLRNKHPIQEMLKYGKAGDTVDIALRGGLKIGSIEDVGSDIFYAALKDIESWADKTVPGLGKLPKGVTAVNKFVDKIMWDRFNTGAKLLVFQKEYEKAILRNAKLHQKNPTKYQLRPQEQIAADVAEYVNDAFGGLNWRRIAEKTRTKLGRKVMLDIHSPGGRRAQQIALFAPDWTIANLRVLRKALPWGATSKDIANMHRWYALKASMFYLTAGNAINYLMSGHMLWENEDPSSIDMGDGRKMTFSKQFVEPYHWITNPGKSALNKMGVIPRSVFELAMNKRWLSPRGHSPEIWDKDAAIPEIIYEGSKQVGSKFVPIGGQQIHQQGAEGLFGLIGHPVYGKSEDENKTSRGQRYDR